MPTVDGLDTYVWLLRTYFVQTGGYRRASARCQPCIAMLGASLREETGGRGRGCLSGVVRSFVRWRLAGAVAAERAGHVDMGTPSTRTCWKPEVQRRAAAVGGGSSAWALGREAWEARYLAAGKRF